MFYRVFNRTQIDGSLRFSASHRLALALTLVTTLACGSETPEPGDEPGAAGGIDSSEDAGSGEVVEPGQADKPAFSDCSSDKDLGGFLVQLDEGFTQVEGQVFDSVDPRRKVTESEAGDCRLLLEPKNFCDPPCGPTDTCGREDTCVPKPLAVHVGTVTVRGLSSDVSMKPGPTNFYVNVNELPHPGFGPDARIQLDASGGDLEGFNLVASGVTNFVSTQEEVSVEKGEPVSLSWTAASSSSHSARIVVSLDIGHHGGSPATIECFTDDDGALEIDAELIDQLIDYGVAGFPVVTLSRQSAGSEGVMPGCVELIVSSAPAQPKVLIDGLISCNDDTDCPKGKTCQDNLSCN